MRNVLQAFTFIFCIAALSCTQILPIQHLAEIAMPYDNCYEWGVFGYINLWDDVNFGCCPAAWSLLVLKICFKSFHQYWFDRRNFFTCLFSASKIRAVAAELWRSPLAAARREHLAYWHRLRKVLQASNTHTRTHMHTWMHAHPSECFNNPFLSITSSINTQVSSETSASVWQVCQEDADQRHGQSR